MSDAEAGLDRADMARLVDDDESAFDALMGRHAGRLIAYLTRLLQDPLDAEDLAQETFVRVFEHRRRFDPTLPFRTWLYTIATNLVRDRYRWRTRHPEHPWGEAGPDGVDHEGFPPPSLTDSRPLPVQGLEQAERAEAVRRAVAALPPELREALVLTEFEERPHLEAATILGCTAKAVEMRVYRARQALRKELAAWLAG